MTDYKKDLMELKEAFVELCHAVGHMIPENSELDKKVKKWSKE